MKVTYGRTMIGSIISLMFVGSALSQSLLNNITVSTCANSGGYTACLQPVIAAATKCIAEAGSDLSLQLACECTAATSQLGCALTNCWNVVGISRHYAILVLILTHNPKVYGCEYQTLASQIVSGCFGRDIPFFSAPENVPGQCSCNLGHVIYNMTAVFNQYSTCAQQSTLNTSRLLGCACCYAAGEYTS